MHVRRAVPGDEPIIRELRLRALADAPAAFGSTLERERARTPADWSRWTGHGATFLLEHDGEPGGLAAGVPHAEGTGAVFLMSMWVDPGLRGSGAADALIAALFRWASAEGFTAVHLHVGDYNTAARRCYERHGFRATGEGFRRERDGVYEVEMRRDLGPGRSPTAPPEDPEERT